MISEGDIQTIEAAKRYASPLDVLWPHQRAWLNDNSRFKIGMMARQIAGKSFTTAMEATRDCLLHKTTWVCLSRGERQALEWMEKVKMHVEAFQVALAGYEEQRGGVKEALLKVAEARFANGSRIIALPANPDTARGYSANLLLDEFALHEDPDGIWRAIYPSIGNPLKGQFKIRIISTPNGLTNKFAQLWNEEKTWSRHKFTATDAIECGLLSQAGADELREGFNDPEGWAQEYECEFMDSSIVLLPYELIASCESAEASTASRLADYSDHGGIFIGWDFARVKDLSVPWIAKQVGDVLQTVEVIEMRAMSTPDQISLMRERLRVARRVSIDYTGPGIGLGDLLVKEFGEWNPDQHQFGKIELVTFTNTIKLELFPALRVAFEQKRVRVPVNRAIREDLHSMQRVSTPSGNITYRAPRSDDGHADRCNALALALRAAKAGNTQQGRFIVAESPRYRAVMDRAERSVE